MISNVGLATRKKTKLIESMNPAWNDLSTEWCDEVRERPGSLRFGRDDR